jgi:hypothetical protein
VKAYTNKIPEIHCNGIYFRSSWLNNTKRYDKAARMSKETMVFVFNEICFRDRLMSGETNNPPHATDARFEIPEDMSSILLCTLLSPVMLLEIFVQKQASAPIIIAIINA